MIRFFTSTFSFLFFLLINNNLAAQDFYRRTYEAKRIQPLPQQEHLPKIKVDGYMDEPIWRMANVASEFSEFDPTPKAPARYPTEVRLIYDDKSIYVFAKMYDPNPDSIRREMTPRDKFGQADIFGVVFDPYRDGINGLEFYVSAAGVQVDSKFYGANVEDFAWSAVWSSAVQLTTEGWQVELEIPLSALRFPTSEHQQWRVNFERQTKRYRSIDLWNPNRPDQFFIAQCGELAGISNLKAPIRLQATPFLATYVNNFYDKKSTPSSSWARTISGGMDIKYGINDAFTLDMTLVPDFGQVQFDNKILNLSPFEVRFDENRPFFTEGVELFNKGNLFYSRRVGGRLFWRNSAWDSLSTHETMLNNPEQAQLYNATKLSGRTNRGLGIGFFNGTAAPTYATLKDTINETERRILTNPLTNYNIISLDQNLPNNSSMTFLNTNVWRADSRAYNANVTAFMLNLKDKKNAYGISTLTSLSQKYFQDSVALSVKNTVQLGKISGKWQWQGAFNLETWNYDHNDLGFLQAPNEKTFTVWGRYTQFAPKGKFNRYYFDLSSNYVRLHRPDKFTDWHINASTFFLTRKIFAFGANVVYYPIGVNDYFEPRNNFQSFFNAPYWWQVGGFISTDYRKKYALDVRLTYNKLKMNGMYNYAITFAPRVRFSDKLFLVWSLVTNTSFKELGYVGKNSEAVGYSEVAQQIVFGKRDNYSVSNAPTFTWNVHPNLSFSFRMRHYWAKVRYEEFLNLRENGSLTASVYRGSNASGAPLHNQHYTAFNIDAVLLWRFAPGSDLSIVWKNTIEGVDNQAVGTYINDFDSLANHPQINSFSIKAIYFLDYIQFRKNK